MRIFIALKAIIKITFELRSSMDELKAIKYFIKVVELGSFTQAARHFNVPASSLSRRVSDLETHLGASLLKRSTRMVKLTEIGEQYFQEVKQVLSQFEQTNEAVRSYQAKPMGRLKISAMTGFGQKILIPILDEFSQHYPEVVLDLHLTDELSSLAHDEVDVAFRGGYAPNERINAVKLMDNHFIPVISPAYIDRYGMPTHAIELRQHRGLYYRTPIGHTPWLTELGGQWHDVSGKIQLCTNDGAWLIEKALKGEGILMLPQWVLAEYIEKKQLMELHLSSQLCVSPNPDFAVFMLYQKQRYHVPKVKAIVDFMLKKLTRNG